MSSLLKKPINYIYLGIITLLSSFFGSLILNIILKEKHTTIFNYLWIFGLIFIVFGINLYLAQKETTETENPILEKYVSKLNNKNLKNILRNLYLYYKKYKEHTSYMCKFYKKSGGVLWINEDSKEKADGYMRWYLDTSNSEPLQIILTGSKAIRILKDDIDKFEYTPKSLFRSIIIDPLKAFLFQPSKLFISLKGSLIFVIIILIVGSAYEYAEGILFNRGNNLALITSLIKDAFQINLLWLFNAMIIALGLGLFSARKSLDLYHKELNDNRFRHSLLNQVIVLNVTFLFYSYALNPALDYVLKIAQKQGL